MRALGIDFGQKRVGLALSDPTGRLVTPFKTIRRTDDASLITELTRVALEEGVETLVIGEPLALSGARGAAARRVRAFANRLKRATGLPCISVDEALTTHEAEARLRDAGIDPRRHPGRADAVAAQIILEEALTRFRSAESADPTD